jgi:RHS repeat-associated protein
MASSPLPRAHMAVLLTRGFDFPVTTDPNTSRAANFLYAQGLLTGVTGGMTTYGTLSYHPNLLVSQILHGNGVTETQGNDPNQMRRPSSLSASGAYASWSSGVYGYDGAGNIKAIGTSWYAYDKVSRLVSATLYDGATGGGAQKQQSYTFDAFGNLTNIAGTIGRATPTSAQTNRLNGTGTVYDAAGNLTNWNSAVYQYDAFNQMIHMTSGLEDWVYLYTADDERIWSYNVAKNTSRWALRDLGGKVLREYLSDNGRWSVGTDYIYRDGLLLAAETQTGQRHFHLDHLGTPRLITRASGYPAGYHVYYPFGEEATAFNQDSERMKFTGHERDLASPAAAGDDLDYMHARHESPVTGRFLSPDPLIGSVRLKSPQSWNRYSYVAGNPLDLVDPNGERPIEPAVRQFLEAFFGTSLAFVDVQWGMTANMVTDAARGADAVTFGSTIYLAKDTAAGYLQGSEKGVALIAHEIVHTFDYSRVGKLGFLVMYGLEANSNVVKTRSLGRSYLDISFEVRTNVVQRIVTEFLRSNTDVRDRVAKGEPLTKEQLQRIKDYAVSQVSNGELREGLQYINGQLVFVRLTVQ